ncbi:ABC transporter permease [Halostagnicola sp. A-GB9-2]|uniref:ABC transporter permease n=1 Tax=Halostagnicola sp. A-GB9-2 TaxID=3048066 RepID=UPI0024BFD309|nr:ABC transporter permease [Halostagnicola sp. A-GB9-2]MDJ1433838.1 ABC transporter permease [Halostagnicola sp. A-GB9-2]
MDVNLFLSQLFNGVALGLLYVLVASGLTLIFGVTGILNFAHGALFMLGAFFAVSVVNVTGSFWVGLLVAPLLVGFVGLALERTTIQPLYQKDIAYSILLTFGLALIITDGVELLWGSQRSMDTPGLLAGAVQLGPLSVPRYQIFVMCIAATVAIGLWAFFERTDLGLVMRAGSQRKETVRLLGIDISRSFTLVFGIGSGLAGLAGVLMGPMRGVNSGMGDQILFVAFIVVILGGLGSFKGAAVAGLVIGILEALGQAYVPQLTGYYIYIILIATLLVRPQGLYGYYGEKDIMKRLPKVALDRHIKPLPLSDSKLLSVVALLALFPVVTLLGISDYYLGILTLMLVMALLALSLDLVLGYLGLLSLGHAAFFGIGAYGASLTAIHLTNSLFVALVVATVCSMIFAWFFGLLAIRFSGIFFAIITLAIAQVVYLVAGDWEGVTGGEIGMGVPTFEVLGYPLESATEFYYAALALTIVLYAFAVHILDTPFGRGMVAIREGERRATFLGYDTALFKRRALVVSAPIAAVGGVLFAGSQSYVTPTVSHWLLSAEAALIVILGGMGTLFGPMAGAAVFVGMEQLVSTYVDQWRLLIGLLIVLVVLFAPRGFISIYDALRPVLTRIGIGSNSDNRATDVTASKEGEQ